MCYTNELNLKDLSFVISDCFGIGFDWKKDDFIKAVNENDPRIMEIMRWAVSGEADKFNDASQFDGSLCLMKMLNI